MKIIDIALKDITQSFRNAFAIVFMLVLPIMVTGMFYLMFGNQTDDGGIDVPQTKVVLVNLDQGSDLLDGQNFGLTLADGSTAGSLGAVMADVLQGEDFADLLEITFAENASTARQMVDSQQAGVAIIIPTDFSSSFIEMDSGTEIELYQDPTLILGPAIVQSVINNFIDGFSGVQIAVNVALQQAQAGQIPYTQIEPVAQEYIAYSLNSSPGSLIDTRSVGTGEPPANAVFNLVGGIMAGMMIFYAFFTGASTAQSILQEEERGTLPRLFTTPTSQATILGGKFLGVSLTVTIQVLVLIVLARLIFKIEWGSLLPLTLVIIGLILTATSFGILFNSLMRSTKQSGVIFGGVLTVTGMIGMIDIFTGNPGSTGRFGNLPLIMPQGWASRGLLTTMQGATAVDVLPYLALMLLGSAIFFILGVWRFQRRYV